jgi:rhamnosyl/mannosyltransferase
MPSGAVVYRHRELGRVLSTPLSPAFFRAVRGAVADVLHVHMPYPPGELAAFLNVHDVPLVLSFHSQLSRQQILEPVYGPLRRRVLERAAVVLVSSEQLFAAPELSGVRAKVRVLPYGVSPRLVARQRIRYPDEGALRVLFVGRLVYYKGIDVLMAAVAGADDAVLTVVGDGPLRSELERLAVELGLGGRVRFAGGVHDAAVRNAYATHDVLVLPSVSRAEAFGMTMIEAMANGLPVISTGLGTGTDWVNLDGETGLVVPPGDVEALVQALKRMGSLSLRRNLGRAARSRSQRWFSFSSHIEELLRVYKEIAR